MTDIEKALKIMGATQIRSLFYFERLDGYYFPIEDDSVGEPEKALFLHECRLFLREKGYPDVHSYSGATFAVHVGGGGLPVVAIAVEAPTECEAFAKAVIRAGEEGRED